MAKISDPAWQALLEKNKLRRAEAQRLADAGRPMKFEGSRGERLLVSLDLDAPGEWRVTYFDVSGIPTGHYTTRTAYEAFFSALGDGYKPASAPSHNQVEASTSPSPP